MTIQNIRLAKSPFDSGYVNVPANPDSSITSSDEFKSSIEDWLLKRGYVLDITENSIKAKAFLCNTFETVRIKVPEHISIDKDFREYNYAIIHYYEGDETKQAHYFITKIEILNALISPTATLTLTKDIWAECYFDCLNSELEFGIVQQHNYVTDFDSKPSSNYQNVNLSPIQTVVDVKHWDKKFVLWAVFKFDPTVTYYEKPGTNQYESIGHSGPNPTYGTYQYFYYPVGVYYKGEIHPITTAEGRNRVYFPRVYGTYLLSQQLTLFVPFDYSIGTNGYGDYVIEDCSIQSLGLYYKYGELDYYALDRWSGDEATEFYCYQSHNSTTVSTTELSIDLTPSVSPNNISSTNTQLSPYAVTYPFHYFKLAMPDGTEYSFEQGIPLGQLRIKITPTDSGAYYNVSCETIDGNSVFLYDGVFNSYEITGDIPKSTSAYLEYMQRAGVSLDEQKRYALEKASYNATMGALSGTVNVAMGAVGLASGINVVPVVNAQTGEKTTSVTSVDGGIDTSVGAIARGAVQIGGAISGGAIEKKHISNEYNAKIADLSNTTATRFQKSNQLNNAPYWDIPVLYEITAVNNDINRYIIMNFVKYGTQCQRCDNPLTLHRKYFEYVRTSSVNYTNIGNEEYRLIFNAILMNGVTMWNINNYVESVLDWRIKNTEIAVKG